MESLPFSWQYTDEVTAPQYLTRRLPLTCMRWVYEADLPWGTSLESTWNTLKKQWPCGVLVHGVSPPLVRALKPLGAYAVVTGMEAVLPLDRSLLAKKSLAELVRRGLRHGRVVERNVEPALRNEFEAFRVRTAVGGKPQLKYFFRTELLRMERLFVFESPAGEWLACVTLTRNSPDTWYTELILRQRGAPVGVVEALFAHVHHTLAAEGNACWSLGEVPFYGPTPDWRSQTLARVGRSLRFAYNARSLYRFKDKFQPEWRPVCLVGTHRISLLMFADLFLASGIHRLVLHGLWQKVRGLFGVK